MGSGDRLTFGSLFAGVGGFDLGLEAAGWECAWQVEWEPNCQQTLGYWWPGVPRWGDVTTVSGSVLPPVDVIVFGSPCQDLSLAGKRAGLEGDRSGLFFEATRIIQEMKDESTGTFPRLAVWENVPGALTSTNGDDFEAVLTEMAKLGASFIEWAVLDARYFGVPQRRRRLFLVAIFDPDLGERMPEQLFALGDRSARDTSPSGQTQQGLATDVTGSPDDAGTIFSFDTQFGSNANVFVNMAPTLKSTQQPPSISDGTTVRRLTPVECERLMGWPDDHTLYRADGKTNSDTARYKMCGNGVASPVAQWIAEQINKADRRPMEEDDGQPSEA